jgi:hypothetical protein
MPLAGNIKLHSVCSEIYIEDASYLDPIRLEAFRYGNTVFKAIISRLKAVKAGLEVHG